MLGGGQNKLEIVRQLAPNEKAGTKASGELQTEGDLARVSLDTQSAPIAALALPQKLNGARDVVVLSTATSEAIIVENAANTTITVDRTDDPAGAGLTAASVYDANANNCSLRGAFQYANNPANPGTTIVLPAWYLRLVH